jgi:hypothetical protein
MTYFLMRTLPFVTWPGRGHPTFNDYLTIICLCFTFT